MKGGGKNGLFERNLVLCTKDETSGGTRIGLSLGGGGTDPQFCAPAFDSSVPCAPEMTGSTIRNNIIANCSDVGIYLNQAKDTKVLYNTLIATSGVDFRFATSSGEADGNILASAIRTRDGATMTLKTNLTGLAPTDFAAMFVAPLTGDLRKNGDLSSLIGKGTARADVTDDYCARSRAGAYDLGALQVSLGDCDTTTPPAADGGAAGGVETAAGDGTDASAPGAGTSSGGATSGEPSTDGGASPGANAAAAATPEDDGGCGCRAAGSDSSRPLALVLTLFVAVSATFRRRSRSSDSARRGRRRS
jgi:MYXO-CTERM domain-containing protein